MLKREITPERQGRIDRIVKMGFDNGMRLRITWQATNLTEPFSIVVHSWEAAAAFTGRNKLTLPVYFSSGRAAEGLVCINPSNGQHGICFFEMEQPAKRGPRASPDRVKQQREKQRAQIDIKIDKLVMKKKHLLAEVQVVDKRIAELHALLN